MASISINLGDAFLLDTPPYGEHLYIAIAKTSENKYLFVNVTALVQCNCEAETLTRQGVNREHEVEGVLPKLAG